MEIIPENKMNELQISDRYKNFAKDGLVRWISVTVILFCILTSTYINTLFGIIALFSFTIGCTFPLILIKHNEIVTKCLNKFKDIFGFSNNIDLNKGRCEICDLKQCQRHKITSNMTTRTPWKDLLVNENLDKAVESFYTQILNSFVESWFSLLSHDDDFVQTLKQGLREATCHIIVKFKMLDISKLLTYKLLPIAFDHIEIVKSMLDNGVQMDKLPNCYIQNEYIVHPAVINRRSEIDYLRAVSKCLIPRLFHNENFNSKIFFSLVRELLACWVLLPLMDVISDPNLINLIIIYATDSNKRSQTTNNNSNRITLKEKLKFIDETNTKKVEFLKNFVKKSNVDEKLIKCDENILNERDQLYVFMQYLKKEGAVDELRFYLDVDSLNKELQDPKVTTDPAKLSSLHQQSEKLLQDYNKLVSTNETLSNYPKVQSLTEAHENVKKNLEGKWRKAFTKTPEYFQLIYGSKEVKLLDDSKNLDQSGTVSRLGTKLKDVIRGAIDGALLDATEVPTVWDALAEPQVTNTNSTIYSSVTSKLKKERGQNLDSFLVTFMQSIEQSPDIGEEVIEAHDIRFKQRPNQPGRNLVFGNLFGLNKSPKYNLPLSLSMPSSNIKGPSQCLLYILYKLLNAPIILVNLIFAFICISKSSVDSLICYGINKLIKCGLYEPRLAVLIKMLEIHLFETQSTKVSPNELLERQRQARKRIENLRKGSGYLIDVLQSPALNKHIMYCMFDIILAELYPEFDG